MAIPTYSKQQENNDKVQGVSYLIYGMFIFILSLTLLFGGRDPSTIEDYVWFLIYVVALILVVVWTIFVKFNQRNLRKNKSTDWITAYDFSDRDKIPDAVYNNAKWVNNPFKLLVFSIALFSTLILISGTFGTFFTAFPEMQVREATDLLFSAEPVTTAENGMLLIPFGLISGLAWKVSGYKRNNALFVSIMFLNVLIHTLLFVFWHTFRYPLFTQLYAVGIFAFLGLLLTWLTGSIIPFMVFHITDNLFGKISAQFGDFTWILVALSTSIIMWVLTIYLLRSKPQKAGA